MTKHNVHVSHNNTHKMISFLLMCLFLVIGILITPQSILAASNNTIEIGNFVWLDENANGMQDASEQGINHVTVLLMADPDGIPFNDDDSLVGFTVTDANGQYTLLAEPNTSYYISIHKTMTSNFSLHN